MGLRRLPYAAAFLIVIRIAKVENNAHQVKFRADKASDAMVQPMPSDSSENKVAGPGNDPDDGGGRIIDGVPAMPGEFPFMVSVQNSYNWRSICGGSLISERHVLTACHCVMYKTIDRKYKIKPPNAISLLAGTLDVTPGAWKSGVRGEALVLRHHSNCARLPTGWTWDIGIVTVKRPFRLTPGYIDIIPLPMFSNFSIPRMSYEEARCTGMGWGKTDAHRATSNVLLKVELQLQPEEVCYELILLETVRVNGHKGLRFSETTQVCTLGSGRGDACQGDSGGPLICVTDTGKTILTAVVSWGIGCGRYGVPGIWARLDSAEPWIRTALAHANHNSPSYLVSFGVLTVVIKTIRSSLSSCCFLE